MVDLTLSDGTSISGVPEEEVDSVFQQHEKDLAAAATLGEESTGSKIKSEAAYQWNRGFKESFSNSVGKIMEADWGLTPYRLSLNFGDDSLLPSVDFDNGLDLVGVTGEEWDNMDGDQRRNVLNNIDDAIERRYFDKELIKDKDKFSWWKLGGMLTDPTSVMPVFGTTAKTIAASSAVVGGTDAAVWSYAQEGKVDPVATAIGAVAGGVVGGGVAKLASKMKEGGKSWKRAGELTGLGEGAEGRQIKFDDTWWEKVKNNASVSGKFINDVIEPISDRLTKINPKLGLMVDKFHMNVMKETYKNDKILHPFIKKIVELRNNNPQVYSDLWKALANEDQGTAESIFRLVGMENDWKVVSGLMTKTAQEANEAGRNIKLIDFYFPMRVKDVDGLTQELSRRALDGDYAWLDARQAAKLKDKLNSKDTSKAQRAQIIENFLRGYLDPDKIKTTPSYTKARMTVPRDMDLLKFYHKPEDALIFWNRTAVEDKNLRQLLGKPNSNDSHLIDNDDALVPALDDWLNQEAIKGSELMEARDLLQSMFQGVHKAPLRVINNLKASAQGALLANPVSAMTQLQDFAFALRYSTRDALPGLIDAIKLQRGTDLDGFELTAKDFGIMESMTAELLGEEGPHRVLTKLLKASGFTNSDQLGKDTFIRSGLRKMIRQAKTQDGQKKLLRRWGSSLGNKQTKDMIAALNRGDYADPNVKLALFSDLANIQPITPAGMPKKYWDNPNMRFMWTLRSFQMKYLNQIRQHVAASFGKGSRANNMSRKEAIAGLTALTGLTAMMGVPVSALKNSLMGRDEWTWEELMVNEGFKATGFLSKYDYDKFGETNNIAVDALSFFAPPVNVFEAPTAVGTAIITGNRPSEWTTRKTVSQIPLFGKMYEAWFGDPLGGAFNSPNYEVPGNELWNMKKRKENFRKQFDGTLGDLGPVKENKKYWQEATY